MTHSNRRGGKTCATNVIGRGGTNGTVADLLLDPPSADFVKHLRACHPSLLQHRADAGVQSHEADGSTRSPAMGIYGCA